MKCLLILPASLVAVHVYLPISVISVFRMWNVVPLLGTRSIYFPFLNHEIWGSGYPSAMHLIVVGFPLMVVSSSVISEPSIVGATGTMIAIYKSDCDNETCRQA